MAARGLVARVSASPPVRIFTYPEEYVVVFPEQLERSRAGLNLLQVSVPRNCAETQLRAADRHATAAEILYGMRRT